MLNPVIGMQDAFCQNISFPHMTFSHVLPIFVIVSMNWHTEKNNYVSAVWAEDITQSRFKACAIVAGRFYKNSIGGVPHVNWFAYQKNINFLNGTVLTGLSGGNIKIPSWYSGSRCVNIQLKV